MHKISHLRHCVLAWFTASALIFCAQAEAQKIKAQPNGKVVFVDNRAGVRLSIGRRRSLTEGNAASLRALARLVQKYPMGITYEVEWSVKVGRDPVNLMVTLYVKPEQSVRRSAKAAGGKDATINNLLYDGIAKEELLRTIRGGGSFRELEKVAADYSQGQQYWR